MKTVNIHEAKTTLSQLLAEVEAGEDVVIARNGAPIARLTRLQPFQRTPGILSQEPGWQGFVYDPGLFAPLDDAELAEEGWPV